MIVQPLTNGQRIKVLGALIEYCEDHIASRRDWQNDRGLTCDELGCGICNADSSQRAAEAWFQDWENGATEYGPAPELPFDLLEVLNRPDAYVLGSHLEADHGIHLPGAQTDEMHIGLHGGDLNYAAGERVHFHPTGHVSPLELL
jgi:hypothetical protein